jgi:hypothetical protein
MGRSLWYTNDSLFYRDGWLEGRVGMDADDDVGFLGRAHRRDAGGFAGISDRCVIYFDIE